MTSARATAVRVSIGVVGVIIVASAVAVGSTEPPDTSFFTGAAPLALLMTIAGLCLLACGLLVLRLRPTWRSGPLLVLAAILWFGPIWIAWDAGPVLIRSLGMVAVLFTPFVLALVLTRFPVGRDRVPRRGRVLVAAGGALGIATVVFALFYDPFHDVGCWMTCGGNAFLIASLPPLAGAAVLAAGGLGVAVLAFATVCILHDARTHRGGPWAVAAVAAPPLVLGAALDVVATAAIGRGGPGNAWAVAAQAMEAIGILVLVGAFAFRLWLDRSRRMAIDDLVRTTSGAGSPAIQDALRVAAGDPTLSLAYWLPESRRFIEIDGRVVTPETAGKTTVTIRREGHPVATIRHGPLAEVEPRLSPSLRLAIENASLRAELDVQLAELRAARTRIVVAQDDRRRELERALHDGAQHRLTVLVLQLRAIADLAAAGGMGCAQDLQRGIELARAAIDELREVAHGIYPMVLESGGLASALATFATKAPIAIELDGLSAERMPAEVEMTAYRFVVSAVEDASRRRASHVVVGIGSAGGMVTVEVADDTGEVPAPSSGILDRVGAVGGTVRVIPGRIVGELPCES